MKRIGEKITAWKGPSDHKALLSNKPSILKFAPGVWTHSGLPEASDALAYEPVQRLLAVRSTQQWPTSVCYAVVARWAPKTVASRSLVNMEWRVSCPVPTQNRRHVWPFYQTRGHCSDSLKSCHRTECIGADMGWLFGSERSAGIV